MNSRRPVFRAVWLCVVTGVLAILFLGCCALGQEPGTAPETRAEDPAMDERLDDELRNLD